MRDFINGLFPEMADEEYFGKAELTNSSFRLLAESALHLKHKKNFEVGGARFVFGSALHCYVLENDQFEKRYATENFEGCDFNKNSNKYKDAKVEWLKSVEGKDILSVADYSKIKKMGDNVRVIAGSVLSPGDAEVAMFAEIDDVQMSGKADFINHKMKYLFDIKTTKSIRTFGTSMVDYNYVTQAALYTDLIKRITGVDYSFAFVLVEVTAPYMVRITTASPEVIEIGRQMYSEFILKYKDFRDKGIYDLNKTAQAPDWFLKKYGYEV